MRRRAVPTPFGAAVVIDVATGELPEALAALPASERAICAQRTAHRQREYIAGRTALHLLVGADTEIGASDRGAPSAAGWSCSIAHKQDRGDDALLFAAALAAPAPSGDAHVGIDLELAGPPRVDIAAKILTPRELAARPDGAGITRVFAIKEAIYKAIDPLVRRYVRFDEVEVDAEHGGVTVVDPAQLPVAIEIWSTQIARHWIACARARRTRS